MARKKAGNVLPSGSVRYRLYVGTDGNGKKIYKSFTGASKAEARRAAEIWQKEHVREPSSKDLTFAAAGRLYVSSRSRMLSPSVCREYLRMVSMIEAEFPDFASKRVIMISTQDVQELLNRKAALPDQRRGRVPSPKTLSNLKIFVSSVLLSQGVEIGRISLPLLIRPDLNIPEEEDVQRLIQIVEGTEFEIPVLLAAIGPMRRGEICGLDPVEDVNFETGAVTIRRTMVKDSSGLWVRKPAPKTAAGFRTIIFPIEVTDRIRQRGYVTSMNPDSISRNFRRLLSKHGLDFRFHDLRHYSASFQLALGVPAHFVMERGGWATADTMKRYVHALDKQKAEQAEKINSAFSSLVG